MALGVAFGLLVSLTLKHSYLAQFPKIESCLVALCAYTCYFFSNGIQMSGIVSLLFCGITLKHYAYHTMSRRTQRATKYIFSILAQFTENFIFIYLGLSLFTSPPSGSKVTSYVKPLFIIISTVAVVFVRYASVFPLSEAINLFQRHVHGQRTDEIPYSYQMMLFWAGLRGAVGVALAAGFKGENAQILRTTVLVVVVLTVVMFGGTTARMLEVLGIRTGVEDDGAVSSDEEEATFLNNSRDWYRRRSTDANDWTRYPDDDAFGAARAARITAQYNHHTQSARTSSFSNAQQIFSASSSDSYDSDGEVLPLASPGGGRSGRSTPSGSRRASLANTPSNGSGTVPGEEHKWFSAIDERYLLPLFSNAPASRSFHARRQRRSATLAGSASASSLRLAAPENGEGATPAESEDEGGDVVDLRESAISRSRTTTGNSAGSNVSANGTGRGLRIDSASAALRSSREPDRQPSGKFGL